MVDPDYAGATYHVSSPSSVANSCIGPSFWRLFSLPFVNTNNTGLQRDFDLGFIHTSSLRLSVTRPTIGAVVSYPISAFSSLRTQ
ncbi:hypothetical protein BD626DRAFT_489304 [Schizophyllum amplum]|uniref:Uncharacterized protein n=1 Tax=Schizophyllum amplum TaxID=97359 RepID=A0A550CLI2_9AGAR|nr:hypothetical protein BD626DRAFT_489304 [Auriculariopsis ampla]